MTVLRTMLSSSLLQLAAALRINVYQGLIPADAPINLIAAGIYYEDAMQVTDTDVKLVSDKILHAEQLSKPIISKEIVRGAMLTFHLTGKHRGRSWHLDVCLQLLAERILSLLDEIDAVAV